MNPRKTGVGASMTMASLLAATGRAAASSTVCVGCGDGRGDSPITGFAEMILWGFFLGGIGLVMSGAIRLLNARTLNENRPGEDACHHWQAVWRLLVGLAMIGIPVMVWMSVVAAAAQGLDSFYG